MESEVVYSSAAIYIESATSLQDKITKIDAIITALLDVATTATATDNIDEYWLDSGQTKIKTKYRGVSSIFASIQNFEKLKTMYQNKLNGHSMRLIDSRNFRSR
jgi:peptidyl-tRNA hydrolase